MNSWLKVRRALGASDSRHWRIPGLLGMRLRQDHVRRLFFSLAVGVGIAGPFAAIMLAVAPPDEFGWAALLSVFFVFPLALLAFFYNDLVDTIISLEDDGLHRRIKPLLLNPLGWRNRHEFWPYDSISECRLVPATQFGGKYAMLVADVSDETLALFVPTKVNLKKVVEFLDSQDVPVNAIKQMPAGARPQSTVGGRALKVAIVMGGVGICLAAAGCLARLAIYRETPGVDRDTLAKTIKAAPPGTPLRQYSGVGRAGVQQAHISPDGKRVWAFTKGKQHLVWNDQQLEPVGELDATPADKYQVAFSSDSKLLALAAGQEVELWELSPPQRKQRFTLAQRPDRVTLSVDASQLFATTMTHVQQYDVASGQATMKMPITLGPITDVGLSSDGEHLVVIQHSRILQVHLDGGAVEELLTFPGVHFHGTLSGGCDWAVVATKQGAVVYDLVARKRGPTIASGTLSNTPTISPNGTRLAHPTMQGVGIWDTHSEQVVANFELNNSTKIDLSNNGRFLLGYSYRSSKLIVWEMP